MMSEDNNLKPQNFYIYLYSYNITLKSYQIYMQERIVENFLGHLERLYIPGYGHFRILTLLFDPVVQVYTNEGMT